MAKSREIKFRTVRSAVIKCSKCKRQIAPNETYQVIGGWDEQAKQGIEIKRCNECGFCESELRFGSPFRSKMYQIEERLDTVVNDLEESEDLQSFYTAVYEIIAELRAISDEELTKYEKSKTKPLHALNNSRGTQTREIADHLQWVCDEVHAGRYTIVDVVENAPSDLLGIK